jgi:hypothetical protein
MELKRRKKAWKQECLVEEQLHDKINSLSGNAFELLQ